MAGVNVGRAARKFLIVLACAAFASTSMRVEAAEAESGLTNAFFALCMDTHDAKKRTLAEQAALLKELGYDGAGHLWLDGLPERLRTADAANLKVYQVYLRLTLPRNGQPGYDPRLKEMLPLLKGRETTLGTLVTGGKPSDRARDAEAVKLVREVADLASAHGVRVALYPHVNDWLERVEDALRLLPQIGRTNVGVMFNFCHWLKVDQEENLLPLLRAAKPHLLAVSINGSDRGPEVRTGKGQWIVPLDSGSFDQRVVLKALSDIGYLGPIGLQCYGIPGDTRDHLARSMTAWKKLKGQIQ